MRLIQCIQAYGTDTHNQLTICNATQFVTLTLEHLNNATLAGSCCCPLFRRCFDVPSPSIPVANEVLTSSRPRRQMADYCPVARLASRRLITSRRVEESFTVNCRTHTRLDDPVSCHHIGKSFSFKRCLSHRLTPYSELSRGPYVLKSPSFDQ